MTLPAQLDLEMVEITVWTRGVTLAKEARDTATLLASAGEAEGKHTQSFDNYVDLPDRIGVACRSYARISPQPIETFYEYENRHPDLIILAEETLVKDQDYLAGAKAGCVVVVNTARAPEEIRKRLGPKDSVPLLATLACIDADSFGAGMTLTFDGTEGAGDDTKIGAGVGAAIAGAAAKASGCVSLDSLLAVAENKEAVKKAWEQAKIISLETFDARAQKQGHTQPGQTQTDGRKKYPQVPFAAIVPSPTTENRRMVTGNWRCLRPVVDMDACTMCKTCWLMCPDACVIFDEVEGVSFNLDFCKGCGICSDVCSVGAISRVPELDFGI